MAEQAIMGDMGAIFSEDGVVETFQNDKEALAAAESNAAVSAFPEHRFSLEMYFSRSLFCQLTFLGIYYFPILTSAHWLRTGLHLLLIRNQAYLICDSEVEGLHYDELS